MNSPLPKWWRPTEWWPVTGPDGIWFGLVDMAQLIHENVQEMGSCPDVSIRLYRRCLAHARDHWVSPTSAYDRHILELISFVLTEKKEKGPTSSMESVSNQYEAARNEGTE